MSAGKLQDKLDQESKKLWSARAIKDQVVLMDWNSSSTELKAHSPISILLDILQRVSIEFENILILPYASHQTTRTYNFIWRYRFIAK